ncbi:MAG TPA: ABC transporter permease, partial [Kofleriaceae bacterium]|nr:ABC transporter permease [Kofleriaceae bacterium]
MSSFQSFIARRYLVNTEPVLSGWITGVALVFLAVFATMVAAIAWYPATCMPLPGPTLPGWLWLGGSAALGLLPVLAIAAVLVFAKSRPHRIPGGLLAVMFLALLGALAASGIRASQSLGGHIDWPVPALALAVVAGLGAVLITIGSLAVVISGSRAYGHGWWHWVRVAISVAISPALILVIAVRVIIGQWWRGRVPGARGLLVIGAALWMLAMAPLAAVGARQAVGDVAGAALWGVIPLCAVALILAGIATWQRFGRLRPLRWHLGWAALALIVAAGILASAPWLVTAQRMWPMAHDLGIRTSPMALNIAAGAGIALAVLSGILALIRWRFTFFTTISIAGVALGSMALVIVLGVMTGFESDLREKILGSNAHILVTPKEGSFTEYRGAADIIADVPGVVAQTPFVSTEVVLATRQSYFTVVIKGVDPRTVDKVTELGQDVQEKGALERLWPLAPDGGPLIPAD